MPALLPISSTDGLSRWPGGALGSMGNTMEYAMQSSPWYSHCCWRRIWGGGGVLVPWRAVNLQETFLPANPWKTVWDGACSTWWPGLTLTSTASFGSESLIFYMSPILFRIFRSNKIHFLLKGGKNMLTLIQKKKCEPFDRLSSVQKEYEKLESSLKNSSLEKESSEIWSLEETTKSLRRN